MIVLLQALGKTKKVDLTLMPVVKNYQFFVRQGQRMAAPFIDVSGRLHIKGQIPRCFGLP